MKQYYIKKLRKAFIKVEADASLAWDLDFKGVDYES